MNPKEVKLTKPEELMVIAMTIYYAVPWRYLVIPIIFMICGPIINYYVAAKVLVGNEFIGMCFFVGFISLLLGIIADVFIFLLGPDIYESTKNYLGPIYRDHREKAQRQAIEKVDDRLLK